MKYRMLAGVIALAAFAGLTGCGSSAENTQSTAQTEAPAAAVNTDAETAGDAGNSTASAGNTFVVTLYPEYAPITCENFESLVSQGFYNGLTFHRVVDGFMAQGGDPAGNGTGGSSQTIKGEFSANGVQNTLSHTRGVVSMARSSDPDSASSQFFICYDDSCTFLDGNYAAFGKVTQGMEVVDDFLKVERVYGGDGAVSSPTSPIIMTSVVMLDPDADGHPQVEFTMNDFLNS